MVNTGLNLYQKGSGNSILGREKKRADDLHSYIIKSDSSFNQYVFTLNQDHHQVIFWQFRFFQPLHNE